VDLLGTETIGKEHVGVAFNGRIASGRAVPNFLSISLVGLCHLSVVGFGVLKTSQPDGSNFSVCSTKSGSILRSLIARCR